MGVFRRHRWRRYVEGSHSSLVATDHLAARCIASVNPFSRTNQLPRAHLSANSKRSPTRSHQFQMTISTSGRSPSPLSEALIEGVASRRNIRRSLPRSADTLFARETISFHQINIAVAQPKLTQFKETTAPLSAFLASVFGRAGLVLHGETEVRKRKDLVRQFQVRRHEDRFAFSQTSPLHRGFFSFAFSTSRTMAVSLAVALSGSTLHLSGLT